VRDIFEDVVWSHRGKRITPKTVVQKQYVDAIASAPSPSASAPPAPGKNLPRDRARGGRALGAAGRASILTRPAVEAARRLGFLPGDVLAKVDPYMRPLFDALYDTMDPRS